MFNGVFIAANNPRQQQNPIFTKNAYFYAAGIPIGISEGLRSSLRYR